MSGAAVLRRWPGWAHLPRDSRDVLQSIGDKLNEGEDIEKVDDAEPSVT